MRLSPNHPASRIGAALTGAALLALLPLLPHVQHTSGVYTWTALAPPLLAITLALTTRRLLMSLAAAVVVGAVLGHGPVDGLLRVVVDYGWSNLADLTHLYILGFTVALLGMATVVERSGGTQAVIGHVKQWMNTARSVQVGTGVMGLLVFFDDYANCMLVGPTARPLIDRAKVSREKLAYLLDSTAAPIAGLIPLSTWVGYEIGLLGDISEQLGLQESGYALLLAALPLRFYCVFTLLFVFSSSGLGRDYGPMLRAQRRAASGQVCDAGARPMSASASMRGEPEALSGRAVNAIAPLLLVTAGALVGLLADGGGAGLLASDPLAFLSYEFWMTTLGGSENNVAVLCAASAAGALLAILLGASGKGARLGTMLFAFAAGARSSAYAVGVLLLAWALAALCKDLGTGPMVIHLIQGSLPSWGIPLATFCTAGLVAFATGTSWGTMAILLPTAIPLAHASGDSAVLLATIAAVLDGAIFGDHCSPISDTTVMSSIAAGSDHIDHVKTQLPYALTAMAVALLSGYLPVALGTTPWSAYLIGAPALVGVILLCGRRTTRQP